MAALAGRAVRIAIGSGVSAVEVVGSTQDNFEITREGINITDKDDDGVQTFIDTTIGTWAMSGGVEGVLKNTSIVTLVDPTDNFTTDMEIAIGGLGTYAGKFGITSFSVTGADGAEAATFSMQIVSSGTITFTAA
jgi:predicted secreted protein